MSKAETTLQDTTMLFSTDVPDHEARRRRARLFRLFAAQLLPTVAEASDAALPAAAEFERLHRRLDVLERHMADLMFLQLSAQDLLLGKRRDFSARSRELIVAALRRAPYRGLCPCCGHEPVLDAAGLPLAEAEFDHAFHRGLNRPEHGWLICRPCHREMTHGGYLARFSRIHQFRAFQGAVLAERDRSRARPADAPS
ncbi:hypothetical protein RGI145_23830 (plasmid) [Roseomonas gilardii]|uniref:Uncharacterized protein n=2 Tax=Roseomonas gilardii TaxID=257708 RepID=A0A1L7ANL3_9PROT|nr:hypothetical protein RGI145_23830 [Roseomonas gilardii]